MKVVISLGNKIVNIKDKNLLKKLAELFSISHNNIPIENILTEGMPNANTAPADESAGESVQDNEAGFVKSINNNQTIENTSILQSIAAISDIAMQPDVGNNFVNSSGQQKENYTGYGDKELSFRRKSGQAVQITGFNGSSEFDKIINSLNSKILSFTNSTGISFSKMWDGLISGGKKAKDPWDAVWLSLRDSALKRIGEILKTELFNDLFSQLTGGASSKGFLGTIISGITGLFSGGGLLGKTGPVNYASVAAPVVNTFNNYNTPYYTNRELVNSFTKYADAAEKWQRELKVVNDLFENNRGIKTVQEYLNKIKS